MKQDQTNTPIKEQETTKSKATSNRKNSDAFKTGRWTKEEHFRFLEALKLYGKEWKKVKQHVATRSSTQARSHAQKFFVKLEKKNKTLDQFLEKLDLHQLEKKMIECNDAGSDYGLEDDDDVSK